MTGFLEPLCCIWSVLSDILPILIIPSIGGYIAIRAYHWYKSIETKDLRYRLAEALGVELEYIAGENGSVGAFGPGFLAFDNPRRIDGTMYRGMIDSGGIEHFDVDTQEKLYHFYAHLKSANKVDIRELQDVISAVEKFKKRNRRGGLQWYEKMFGVEPQT